MFRLTVPIVIICAFVVVVHVTGTASGPGSSLVSVARDDGACSVTRVIDGDTVDLSCPGEGRFRARLTGFDTPETFEPGCRDEARLGHAATDRLSAMVRDAQTVDARLGAFDRYGRRLVGLSLDGRDVGTTLIGEGLALRYDGGRRPDWCMILN